MRVGRVRREVGRVFKLALLWLTRDHAALQGEQGVPLVRNECTVLEKGMSLLKFSRGLLDVPVLGEGDFQ